MPGYYPDYDDYSSPPQRGEVRLRHMTVDEAMMELDRGLNDALLEGLHRIKVIHGKGTGTLKLMVRRQLGNHPLVHSLRAGEPREGGAGVTIVELKR